jgi:hypothetical protein
VSHQCFVRPSNFCWSLRDYSTTSISTVAGATLAPFHAENITVIFALPLPTSAGTRTGLRKLVIQQRCESGTRTLIGLAPGALPGNVSSATG